MITLPLPALVEPVKVVGQILQAELGLSAGAIMLGLENWPIPLNAGLYIALLYGPDETIGNNNYNDVDSDGNFCEVQEVIKDHQIDIELMSFDASARVRQQEVLMALASSSAQALMERYSMRVNTQPTSFIPVPDLEETKQLNRFHGSFRVNALHRKVKVVSYYDTLQPINPVPDA